MTPRRYHLESTEEDYCRAKGVSGCGTRDFHGCGSRRHPA
ncbi:hypothetical protein A2U01_0103630, partial [Trifolium medium]|nr:hypothetical protein [Trifolium medium]